MPLESDRVGSATETSGDSVSEGGVPGQQPGWWRRHRVLYPAIGFVALLTGVLLGAAAGSDAGELAATKESLDRVERQLAEVSKRADEAETRLAESESQIAELETAVESREDEIRDLEQTAAGAVEAAQAELEDDRRELLEQLDTQRQEVADDLDARAAQLDQREASLDEREAALDGRAADLDSVESRRAANTFGNGIHVVGQDIEPGVYRTQGGSTCYWARLSGLSGDLGELIANGLPDGPASVEIRSSDAAFESSGCSDWSRN